VWFDATCGNIQWQLQWLVDKHAHHHPNDPTLRIAHLIDGAASHVRCADRAPPKTAPWNLKHAWLKRKNVPLEKYAYLKPLHKPKKWEGEWLHDGGDVENPGTKPTHMKRWKYAETLAGIVRDVASGEGKCVREPVKIGLKHDQDVFYTPPYHCELQPIEKFWLHSKDPISRDPDMRANMTILKQHLRNGFDSLSTAENKKTWCSAWRHTRDAYRKYWANMPREQDALLCIGYGGPDLGEDEEDVVEEECVLDLDVEGLE